MRMCLRPTKPRRITQTHTHAIIQHIRAHSMHTGEYDKNSIHLTRCLCSCVLPFEITGIQRAPSMCDMKCLLHSVRAWKLVLLHTTFARIRTSACTRSLRNTYTEIHTYLCHQPHPLRPDPISPCTSATAPQLSSRALLIHLALHQI